MAGVFFAETFRRDWRQIVYWGAALAMLGFMLTAVIPDVEALNRYADMLQSMPPALLSVFGEDAVNALTTPEGFLAFSYFTYALFVLAVFAMLAGLSVTANDEEAGILDVVLSLPVARWRVVVERFAAYAVFTVVIVGIGLVSLLAGNATTLIEIDGGRLALSAINMVPPALLLIAFTVFASTVFRRRGRAMAVVGAFIVASFFIDFLANAVTHTVIQALSWLSFFTYYDNQRVMAEGLSLANVLVLLVAAGLLLAGGVWFFQRRDVGL